MSVKVTTRILQLLKNKKGMAAETPQEEKPEERPQEEMPPERTPEPFPAEQTEPTEAAQESGGEAAQGSEGKGQEGKEPKEEGKPGKEPKPLETKTGAGTEKPGKYSNAEKSLAKNLPKPPYWLMGMIIFGILSGVLITKTGSTENIIPKLGAIIPFILLPASILLIKKGNEKKQSGNPNYYITLWIGVILLLGSLYGLGTRTMPYAMAAVQSGELSNIGSRTAGGAQGGVQTIIQDAYAAYNRNMQIASGQSIEGDVEKTQKEDVGLDILPPYLPNPKKINQNEIEMLEMVARIKGFDPKAEMTATVVCSMQSRQEAQSWSKAFTNIGELNLNPGTQQNVWPGVIKGIDFDKEVTCYPKPQTCGDYFITITAEADHLRTDAHMENYIIDKQIFMEKIKNFAVSRKTVLRSDAEVSAAVKSMYPEVGDYKSTSEKGAVKVVMATQKAPLIPVGGEGNDESDLTLRVALENAMNGWIISVNTVEVTISPYFTVKAGYCPGWTVEGDKIILSQSYLRNASFEKVTKGLQKVFPSCHLVPRNTAELTEPKQATFLTKVDYNYIVQQKNDIVILTETGEPCPDEGRTSASGSQTTGGQQGTSTGTQTEGQDITACQGKSEGDTCAEKQMCLNTGGQLKCSTECKYNAAKAQGGLSSAYDCIKPQSLCAAGTIRTSSCKSITSTEESTCCIRRT